MELIQHLLLLLRQLAAAVLVLVFQVLFLKVLAVGQAGEHTGAGLLLLVRQGKVLLAVLVRLLQRAAAAVQVLLVQMLRVVRAALEEMAVLAHQAPLVALQ
jgi:hypothetical protein